MKTTAYGRRGRFGLGTIDHFAPFHRSMREPPARQPVAMQKPGAVQDTELNNAKIRTAGVGTTVQRFPSHRSTKPRSAREAPEPDWYEPTATQSLLVRHTTPFSELTIQAAGCGPGCNDQPALASAGTASPPTVPKVSMIATARRPTTPAGFRRESRRPKDRLASLTLGLSVFRRPLRPDSRIVLTASSMTPRTSEPVGERIDFTSYPFGALVLVELGGGRTLRMAVGPGRAV